MRNLFLSISFLFIAAVAVAQPKYDVLWKKVETLSKDRGLTKSALETVNSIYTMAKKEKSQGQMLKALITRVSLEQQIDEDQYSAVKKLKTEIGSSTGAVKAILHSLLAESYQNYYNDWRYQIMQRTPISGNVSTDVETWSVEDFYREISKNYLASLETEQLLKDTKLQAFDAVIHKGNARFLRPTLYDLLAHRAVDYFEDEEQDVIKPGYSFRVDQPEYLMPAAAFLKMKIQSSDTVSVHHKAFVILQKLMEFHRNDVKQDAFIDVDIRRLKLAHQFAVLVNKDGLYLRALESIGNGYPKVAAAGRALLVMAEYYSEEADVYQWQYINSEGRDTTGRNGYVRAEELCKRITGEDGEPFGKSGAEALLQHIRGKRLHLETEQVNVPGLPFLSAVSFRNLDEIHLRVVIVADSVLAQASRISQEEFWKVLVAVRPFKTWKQSLPASNDHQRHRTEIKIDALPLGAYYLLASDNENFATSGLIAAQQTAVSGIGLVQDGFDYFVVNRQSGKPLDKVKAQILLDQYDAQLRRTVQVRGAVLQTDANGHFHYVYTDKNSRNGGMELSSGSDRLVIRGNVRPLYINNGISNSVTDEEKKNSRFYFFTDRAIYRPGQTASFKGLLINRNDKSSTSRLVKGEKTWIRLFDTNGQTVDSLQVETNEYGSITGNFKLPVSRLTGYYRIAASDFSGEISFSVEEYKRPKFSAEIAAPTGTYKLGDSIVINGKATAFAGNNITNASVKFRVVRTESFIFRGFGKRFFPQNEMEIANGILKTNDTGGFRIEFKAIADRETDKRFDYSITAEITDINGETQSASRSLTVSRIAVNLRLGLEDKQTLSSEELQSLAVSSYNAGGIFQQSDINLSFLSLQGPNRLIRQRYWTRPDLFLMSRDSFLTNFPLDEYDRENDPETWPTGNLVYSFAGSTKPDGRITIDTAKFNSGWYQVIAATHDSYGTEIRDTLIIQVVGTRPSLTPAYIIQAAPVRSVEPGSTYVERFGTSASDIYLFQGYDFNKLNSGGQDSSTVEYKITGLNREVKNFTFPVTEKERGGFGINRFFIKDNRVYSQHSVVQVPWTNKELNISYATFRDKTLPGSQEHWKVKISGDKKEVVAAELLGSMYDASLDEFAPNNWNSPDIWPVYYRRRAELEDHNFRKNDSRDREEKQKNLTTTYISYDFLRSLVESHRSASFSSIHDMERLTPPGMLNEVSMTQSGEQNKVSRKALASEDNFRGNAFDTTRAASKEPEPGTNQTPVKARSNFNETAFFLPDLHTDADGNIEFSFTMPEALTKWKLQLLAHTKDLKFGYSTRELVTQKDLMVQPNAMRFLREGDRLELSTKIVNVSSKEITGIAQLELFDAVTMAPLDGWYQNVNPKQYFTVAAGASSEASFPVQVPFDYGQAVLYRITARSTSLPQEISDGEDAVLPVLTNSILVTESMPLPMKTGESKSFNFDKLLKSGSSETLKQQGLTVEFTTNPSWYAVRALPFLAENTINCSERVFSQFYANALAISIANSSPRIKNVIEKWKSDKSLSSALQKNEELKSVLLQETPWLLQGLNDSLQQQNLSRLFESAGSNASQASTLEKLAQFQTSNGGFSWFQGGPDDRFITQYIVSGIGHLQKLGAIGSAMDEKLQQILGKSLNYLDKRIQDEYAALLKNKADLRSNHLSYQASQFLYARSFFPKQPVAANAKKAFSFYLTQSAKFWVNQTRLTQGMIALALSRNGQTAAATAVLKSLKQNAIRNPDLGSYWKDVRSGYFWYQAPVETQSLIIEAFTEIAKDQVFVNELRTWLLKNKQTNHWPSTKATAEACYALLLQGNDWLASEPIATIRLGEKTIDNSKTEAGTGYFREAIAGEAVKPSMGNIQVSVKSNSNAQTQTASPVWGSVYWQYFEKSEKISVAGNAVQMTKKLFIEKNSDRGPVLVPVQDGGEIKVGDKVRVRVELRVDRDLEYVQMKDMRASGFEPLNVLSGYKWQGGLGYYEATGDASTNFFFDHLTRGTHVFEYSLYAAQKGNFSNGITTIQCLYAPKFTSHSEGIRVNIE